MKRQTYGTELRRMRREAGVSMADLADAVGWSIVYISDIERDRRNPPPTEKTKVFLKVLGKEDELPKMLRLAASARKSVEISLSRQKGQEVQEMLIALARRADEGEIDSDLAQKIRQMLEEKE